MGPLIYNYDDPSSFLRDLLAFKKKRHPLFSLRAWSKQMGFAGHASLVFLINGKRKIRPDHLENLERGLNLRGDEIDYWRALVHFRTAANAEEKAHHEARLKVLRPTQADVLLGIEKFTLVADWIHMAVLEMTNLKDFCQDPDWISRRLQFSVDAKSIEKAMERLKLLGLLTIKDQKLVKTNARLTTPKDRASECIREHHRQVLSNAIQAIDEQSVQERIFNSSVMTIDCKRMAEAQDLILKFRAEMAKLMESGSGDETYQLGIQFFKLTQQRDNR